MATIRRELTIPETRSADEHGSARNPGIPLELDWVRDVRVNRSAVERRAASIGTRRTVKKQWQAAWLLRAITFIDLTTLSGDDTPGNVRRLCAKARHPVRRDMLESLGVAELDINVGAVCVYHALVETAAEALGGTGFPVAAVSLGFPGGLQPFPAENPGDGSVGRRRSQEFALVFPGGTSSRNGIPWTRI